MSGWAAALVDLDNDGWKDLVTANSHANDRIEEFEATTYRQANRVFRNTGTRFEDVSAARRPGLPGGASEPGDRGGRLRR